MKLIQNEKKILNDFYTVESLINDLEVLNEFYQKKEISEQEINNHYNKTLNSLEEVEFKMMLNKKEDSMNAILQITAGAGGTESCDWAEMLMRMYLMWAEKNTFKIKELNNQPGDVAGIKTVTHQIEGE